MNSLTWQHVFVSAPDGLRLHARDYRPTSDNRLPLVCLPGLTRNAADFEDIGPALSQAPEARRVIALDYRGRGLSDWDPDPANYTMATESADILALLAALDIGHAIFLGTSRGGLHTMALGASRPTLIAGAMLNDIGPVLEMDGLLRIRSYVGKIAPPQTLEEGAAVMERISEGRFSAFAQADWLRLARQTFVERNGRLAAAYDPALMTTLAGVTRNTPPPPLWQLFEGLPRVPLMAFRGENSDLLSAETLTEMKSRRPELETHVLPGQAHAPPLWEPETIARIAAFCARCDKHGSV
jgi:pimeloyl-ACP methyl ester carboxylesterase